MSNFDDLSLQRTAVDDPAPQPSRGPMWIAILLLLAVVAAAVWYFAFRQSRDVRVVSETKELPAAAAPARPAAEPGEQIALPPLDATDPIVRELVSRLSSHPRVAAWLTTNGLVRNFTVVVTNIADGASPSRHLKPLAPRGQFQVRNEAGAVWLDPRSYRRYDDVADAVAAIDARGAARLYATVKPRIEDANSDLGGSNFDATLQRAIVRLLQTPVIERDVRLDSESVSYKFADPALESLTPAQRQFLRMGPRNVRIVQAKLREIAGYLGIPAADLPEPRVYER